ncbi:copper chaperone PCu(A)C [Blastococcus tunisiensis]|uniref:Copper(I)-binding protein n=1 Tax=Blastococcus tunisiensis TaxID=1798228 RepID=A0A1I1XXC6_9ACTN|nr:copper chaperone PCu(A)C [Blastococcus sp. DSM 46838]SFE12015.1 Copper(I)-binding protein [Blastococcus sp. DSM 46838]
MNRALRAATAGVLLLSPVALSACSAGQVTQTATQERDKVGAMAQIGDITLRAAELETPRGGSYDAGDDAELTLALVNGGQDDDTLVAVDGEGFGDVEIEGPGSSDEIEIAAGQTVFVGEDDASIRLTDLDDPLITGQFLELTLTFENAGEVTLPVTVSTPDDVQDRGETFDFHHEEEGGEEGAEEAARERESAGE